MTVRVARGAGVGNGIPGQAESHVERITATNDVGAVDIYSGAAGGIVERLDGAARIRERTALKRQVRAARSFEEASVTRPRATSPSHLDDQRVLAQASVGINRS